jgi:hypothetical protein
LKWTNLKINFQFLLRFNQLISFSYTLFQQSQFFLQIINILIWDLRKLIAIAIIWKLFAFICHLFRFILLVSIQFVFTLIDVVGLDNHIKFTLNIFLILFFWRMNRKIVNWAVSFNLGFLKLRHVLHRFLRQLFLLLFWRFRLLTWFVRITIWWYLSL